MTLEELRTVLYEHVRDEYLRDNFFDRWLNMAVLRLAKEFLLPALRRLEPYSFTINTTNWLYTLPDEFLKMVFKIMNTDYSYVTILDHLDQIDSMNPAHDDTYDYVTYAAVDVEQRKLAIYPKPTTTTTLHLWYYTKPVVMEADSDSPTCIPEVYHETVLVPRVIIDAFPMIQDMAVQQPGPSLQYWRTVYREGLFGSPKGEVGMLNYLASLKKPRISLGPQHL